MVASCSALEFQNGDTTSLQVFTFQMLLAIFLQSSFLGVISQDACEGEELCEYGPIADQCLRDYGSAAQSHCSATGEAEGGFYVPWTDVCQCFGGEEAVLDGSSDGSPLDGSGSWATTSSAGGMDIKCIYDVLATADMPPSDLLNNAWVTLWLEIVLFLVVFAILFVTTQTENKQFASQSGGAQVAKIGGTILAGRGLRSGHSGIPHPRRKTNSSQRYAVLSVSNPEVAYNAHKEQSFKTPEMEDDPNPRWVHDFNGLVLYTQSTKLEVKVYDSIPGAEPVLIGSAGTGDSNGTVDGVFMNLQEGRLADLDYKMAGDPDESVEIQLFHQRDSDSPKKRAGTVFLVLNMYPAQSDLLSTIATVTTGTSKYEMAILAMVLLSVLDLALWSPAVALSVTVTAGLEIIEFFVAAELFLELLMEVQAARSRGETELWTKSFVIFGVYKFVANLAWIYKPNSVFLQKAIAVGRVTRLARGVGRFRVIPEVDVIIAAVSGSSKLFFYVFVLMVMLVFMFAVVNLSSFGGALQYECLAAGVSACSLAQKTAADAMGIDCPVQCPNTLACAYEYRYPGDVTASSSLCAPLPVPMAVGSDIFRIRDYDNIWRAMVTVFVQATGDGGMHTIPVALDAAGAQLTTRAWLVSFSVSLLLNLVSLNLFLSVKGRHTVMPRQGPGRLWL